MTAPISNEPAAAAAGARDEGAAALAADDPRAWLIEQMRALAAITPAVAHDLRAPINAMVLNLEVLKETLVKGGMASLPSLEQSRLQRYTNALREELGRLHHSLEIYIAHISPRSDRVESIDLRDLASELSALLTAPARKQQVEVRSSVPTTTVSLTANRYHLRQALLHCGLTLLARFHTAGQLEVTLAAQPGGAVLLLPALLIATTPARDAPQAVAAALLAECGAVVRHWAGTLEHNTPREGLELVFLTSEVR
jgi:C4-dicarboxylate-specific signal transduction histidine kinase